MMFSRAKESSTTNPLQAVAAASQAVAEEVSPAEEEAASPAVAADASDVLKYRVILY